MKKNVYNIVWADDEIDDILDSDTISDLKDDDFNIVGVAHDGEELERLLKNPEMVDAVIVDANFNESDTKIGSERDTSGLDYARSLYIHTLKRKIPFFLFTGRSDELLREIYKHNPRFLDDFPRHKRWFSKNVSDEYKEMFEAIKQAVNEQNSASFIIRNKYQYELAAANKLLSDGVSDFIFNFLIHEYENTLDEIQEPFVSVRRSIEKIFGKCEELNLIPPVSNNTNGVVGYFLHNKYRVKDQTTGNYDFLYEMLGSDIMPKPLARSLKYIVDITQDGAHSKNEMKLNVDEYFEKNKDVFLLRSVVYILIDIIRWFADTAISHKDADANEIVLWKKLQENPIVQKDCTDEDLICSVIQN